MVHHDNPPPTNTEVIVELLRNSRNLMLRTTQTCRYMRSKLFVIPSCEDGRDVETVFTVFNAG